MGVNRGRPTANVDGTPPQTLPRQGRYTEEFSIPLSPQHFALADEGSYFVAITPTAGTGIIGHAAPTTFDETKPYLLLYNASTTNRVYPQFITFYETVASVGGTRMQFTVATDTGNRRSSGGTAAVVNNVNQDESRAAEATVYVGAVTAAAATSSRRLLGNYPFRGTIDIIEDSYTLFFGAPGAGYGSGSRVATVQDHARVLPPVVVGPLQSLLVHQWAGSQTTGPTWEVVMGFVER